MRGKRILFGLCLAVFAVVVVGCNDNHQEVSSDYQKLAPSEAQKRLQETLKKRGQTKDLSQTAR